MGSADDDVSAIAFCWLIERSDGAGIALTSSDRDIEVGGISYRAAPGITPAAICKRIGIEPDSAEVSGALSADALTESDLAAGRWTGASLTLTAVAWDSPQSQAKLLFQGELGDVTLDGDGFAADLHGAASRLEREVCPSTTPECRAELGDRRCRVDLAARTIRAKVLMHAGNVLTLDRTIGPDFRFGRLRYLSGRNCGLGSVVLSADGPQLIARDRPRFDLEAGTVVSLVEGCDKRLETCASRFANAVNFRGEPHLPGTDLLTRYPGA